MPKILCIDDDNDILDGLKAILESNGFETEIASNAKEGLEKAKQITPDLLIVDVMMDNDTDGFHLTYNIRKDESLKFKPILMLTSINQKTNFKFNPETDGEFLPVDKFIEKPVKPELLIKTVNNLLSLPNDKINIDGKTAIMD
jgi:CheY-like chemotaxis protein